jgi:hypothetical protein
MRTRRRTGVLVSLTLAALLLGATGCAPPPHSDRGSVDWSRGLRLGSSSSPDPPAAVVTQGGDRLVLAWPARPDADALGTLHLLTLDITSGAVLAEQDLPALANYPRTPMLLPAGSDGLHFLWLDGIRTGRSLYYRFLDLEGRPAGEPARLSAADRHVRDAQAARLPDGSLMVLWVTGTGLSLVHLDATGQPLTPPLARADVSSAALAVDTAGTVHLAWTEQVGRGAYAVLYTTLQPDAVALPVPLSIGRASILGAAVGQEVPWLSVAVEEAGTYVLWPWMMGSQGAQMAYPVYVFVADGAVGQRQSLLLPLSFPPAYETMEGTAALSQVAPALSRYGRGVAMVNGVPTAATGQPGQTLLALSLEARTPNRLVLQPALAVLDDGQILGYALPAWTNYPSVGVAATTDSAGDLYVAWVDAPGTGGHPVYLATTSDALEPVFNRLTPGDVLWELSEALDGVTRGIVFVFPALFWVLLPIVWFVLAFWWSSGNLTGRPAWPVFLVATGLHLASKYLLTRGLLPYIPRLGYVPPELVSTIIYAMPVATVTLGVGIAWLFYIRRNAEDFSPVPAYLIVAVTDAVISVIIYGLASVE